MALRHLYRKAPSPRTVFVLGGGGVLGAVQVGMLRAAIDRGYLPDAVVGCSVGALNGALIAADPGLDAVRRLEDVWLSLRTTDLFPVHRLSAVRLVTGKAPALTANHGLRRLIEDTVPCQRFEEMAVPFSVVATSLRTQVERWFAQGALAPAILASSALPGVYPPVDIDGELFIDGGVVDNVPIGRALEMGADRLIIFHVGNFDRPRGLPRRPIDVLLQSFSIARNYRFRADLDRIPVGVETIVMPGVDPGPLRYNDVSQSRRLIERGYALGARHLDTAPALLHA